MTTRLKKTFSAFIAALIAVGLLVTHATSAQAAEQSNHRGNGQIKQASPVVPDDGREGKANADTAVAISPEEEAMVRLLNQDRANAGLPLLEIDLSLVRLAREKSGDMVAYNYFGHISERLGSVYEQVLDAEIPCTAVAENLVNATNIDKAHLFLMRSSVHRSNILNPAFTKVGIGIVPGGPKGKMITQIFLRQ
mgnify:FL=1